MGERPQFVPEEFRQRAEGGWEYTREAEEGRERFITERILDPNDPRMEQVQKLLKGEFGEDEVDSLDVTREAMGNNDEPYMVFVTQNAKGEIVGVHLTASLRLRNLDGSTSANERILYGVYTVIPKEARRGGHAGILVREGVVEGVMEAMKRGERIVGRISEASEGENEEYHNRSLKANEGMRRMYYRDEEGRLVEVPYQQPPLEWDRATGEPIAQPVREHLMYASLERAGNTINGEELARMVATLNDYNSWSEGDFANPQAYRRHLEVIQEYTEAFLRAVAGREILLLSKEERERMEQQGTTFIANVEPKGRSENER